MNAQSFLKSVAKKLVAASKTLPAFQSPEVAKSMELVLFGLDRLQQALDAGTSDGPKPVARTLFFAPHVAAELVDPVLDGLKKQGKSYSAAAWTVFATYAAEYHPMNLTKLLKHIEDVLDVSLVAKSRKTGWPVYESQDFVDLRPMPVPFDAPATVDAADKGLG